MNPEQGPKPDPMAHLNAIGGASEYAIKRSGRYSENPLPKKEIGEIENSPSQETENIKESQQLLPEKFDLIDLEKAHSTLSAALKSAEGSDNRKILINLANQLLKDYGILERHETLTDDNLKSVAQEVDDYLGRTER